jgi:hypothetical protein
MVWGSGEAGGVQYAIAILGEEFQNLHDAIALNFHFQNPKPLSNND